MSEPATALNGAVFEGLIRIEEDRPRGMITLRGDLSSVAMADAVRAAAGCDVPGTRKMTGTADCAVLWMSPDEVMILCGYDTAPRIAAQIGTALAGQHHLCAVVSDARASFRLVGPHLRDVLAKLTPSDMSPQGFTPGDVRRTRLAQVAAAVWLTGDGTAQVVCFRSVARYVFDLLSVAAQDGSAVGYHS